MRDTRASKTSNVTLQTVIKDEDVLKVLDREKLSSRAGTRLVGTVMGACGIDVNDQTFSRKSLDRERKKMRSKVSAEIKKNFKPPKRCVVHFDGKLLSDYSGNFGDHLAVVLSGNSVECRRGKLLSARMIRDGTGEAQADEVFESLQEWNVDKLIVGMCFDTTASNTGWLRGAAVRIESKLKRPLMWLPCRHHIAELFLGKFMFNLDY